MSPQARLGDDAQASHDAGDGVARIPEEIDLVAVSVAVVFDMSLVRQHDHARALDAAQTVIEAVDCRVELVIAPQGNESQHTRPRSR